MNEFEIYIILKVLLFLEFNKSDLFLDLKLKKMFFFMDF